ncbi:MAG: DUF1822 family protein [Microcoleus sp. SIO2G3]|nr:DUF1822 family protein [Microcoleus sp. SIO2G3]
MIHSTEQNLTLPVPLTLRGHQIAQLFYQQHADAQKAKQVYLNTLAIDAVHSYLNWLGIATDLQASDSWNVAIQALADIADLEIVGQGKLECRPVLPGGTVCTVPPEAWSDRIGYVAVRFDAELQTATLLGFVPKVEAEEVSLSQFQPIATLLEHLKPQPQPQPMKDWVNLGQWMQGLFTSGWQSVEELFGPQPTLSFRSVELAVNPEQASGLTTRVKLLELMPRSDNQEDVALQVALLPNNSPQVDIWVKVCPVIGVLYLPEDLEIRVLDERGIVVMQAQSRQTDMMQLKFRAVSGEQFSIEITLNDRHVVETFII